MKKAYSKPEILFEDFSLSTHIATDCEVAPNDERLQYPGTSGFVFSDGRCEWDITWVGGPGDYNGICYHVLSEETSVFTSGG